MALKLSLKPNEQLVVNGAVIANGDRRSNLVIKNRAAILRERDILQESDVNSPARRIYFSVMMMYIDEANRATYYEEFVVRMTELMAALVSGEGKTLCVAVSKEVMDARYYKALALAKRLIAYEKERLGDASGVSADTEEHRQSA
ncbi:flagellar biosynthesis repressor FlbT [Oceanibacterium hippocampi]|uniref:Flagellar biosynthesis repressor FlbT n=1 Tax=Oceanibacterium hippocampi TaxID=745714 RepID=A0A1Y5TZE1_9PROT|nr:flagellar biosynthesis repressor FlbT [Oceanibacterium hippocampi]SLN77154.1 flagellar biosynthesis repressor FlbT [Oceanibacterium hippocampi]